MDKWVQFDQSIVAAIDHAWHHRLSASVPVHGAHFEHKYCDNFEPICHNN